MKYKKLLFSLLLIIFIPMNIFSNDYRITIEITSVRVNRGNLIMAIYSNEDDLKNSNAVKRLRLQSNNAIVLQNIDLPYGEYVFLVFQDLNNNGILDTNILGFPKEPVGISNYNGGIPSSFNSLKVLINSNTSRIKINLHNL